MIFWNLAKNHIRTANSNWKTSQTKNRKFQLSSQIVTKRGLSGLHPGLWTETLWCWEDRDKIYKIWFQTPSKPCICHWKRQWAPKSFGGKVHCWVTSQWRHIVLSYKQWLISVGPHSVGDKEPSILGSFSFVRFKFQSGGLAFYFYLLGTKCESCHKWQAAILPLPGTRVDNLIQLKSQITFKQLRSNKLGRCVSYLLNVKLSITHLNHWQGYYPWGRS